MKKGEIIMTRMKENYEFRNRTYLLRRVPVILRLDMKAGHTYTRGLKKPFDEGLMEDMIETTKYLCQNIQGAKCGYTQSDEISILLTDYDKLTTDAWFDYNVQKMCSVAASYAASYFNALRIAKPLAFDEYGISDSDIMDMEHGQYKWDLADFDCRVFNIPKEEVANYFLARQKDAVKNSISMVAQSLYSQKDLHKKNQSDMQEMIFQKGQNWNDLHYSKKRGTFVVKNMYSDNTLITRVIDPEKDSPFWSMMLKDGDTVLHPISKVITSRTHGQSLSIPAGTIRTRWEAVETPMIFNEENFKEWL